MRVFITGASGWIGSAAVDELLAHGYDVTGLARSDASAAALAAKGAAVLRGDLDDLDGLRAGAEGAEAVLHLANKHDWANMAESNRAERAAVQTMLDTLAGSGRKFLLAAGVAGLAPGRPATEQDRSSAVGPDSPRGGTENLALDYLEKDVASIGLRFSPTTHGTGDHGFIAAVVAAAQRTGTSAHVGDGGNAWAAVHVSDAARMIRLGLEKAPAGSLLHAVGETAVPTRDIAAAIGAGLGLSVSSVDADDAIDHFGFIGAFFRMDLRATADATRELLGWSPTGPTLLEDIAAGAYFPVWSRSSSTAAGGHAWRARPYGVTGVPAPTTRPVTAVINFACAHELVDCCPIRHISGDFSRVDEVDHRGGRGVERAARGRT
ncbi:NAD-dependent epimerase/dehydratase family protein [Nakamurella sp. YIM 132087]|uniref:NAD-dependent epimerase/dehydratase family protein n=1 Tax=Nakamurella alba TaxID=2665158 RepID=A0A7K1FQ11_9ACTN|nr:NAD-dependent epimerase/dehydratase family protein [Nakamurella alba]MTD15333.1 NAD-dependent epimerase/dehydratase family protein [Nakamurella alba]